MAVFAHSSPGFATDPAINYQNFAMLPALSEPVALPSSHSVRIEQVSQASSDPVPERFLHFHAPAELVLIEQGTGSFFSEVGAYRFCPGTILFAPAMAIHDFAFEEGKRSWTLVQFDPLAVDPQIAGLPAHASAGRLDKASLDRTGALIEWLNTYLDARAPERDLAVILAALLIAIKGKLIAKPVLGMENRPPPSRFRQLLEHWMRAPGKVLDLNEAASLCSISPAYFSRQFNRAFGIGFNAYQTRLRLQQAARLVATTEIPFSQIGYRLGFHSPAYFSKCYKAEFKVTPSLHRKIALKRGVKQAFEAN